MVGQDVVSEDEEALRASASALRLHRPFVDPAAGSTTTTTTQVRRINGEMDEDYISKIILFKKTV